MRRQALLWLWVPAVAWAGLLANAPSATATASAPPPDLSLAQLFQKMGEAPADPCDNPDPTSSLQDTEFRIALQVESEMEKALDAASGEPQARNAPPARVAQAIKEIEALSAKVNARWPEESRFHAEALNVPPLWVVSFSFGSHAHYSAFAFISRPSTKEPPSWHTVGTDGMRLTQTPPRSWISLYPLNRGSGDSARFLASFGTAGCAGPSGVVYDVQEWNAEYNYTQQLISQSGTFGLDQVAGRPTEKDPFPSVGKLVTEGKTLMLPYCWFSALDTWDNPSLCALDSYSLEGERAVFLSRVYNRPDLVAMARAIELGKQHDYLATRAYCESDETAHQMVRDPWDGNAEDPRVVRNGPDTETVYLGEGRKRYLLRKRKGEWRVVKRRSD